MNHLFKYFVNIQIIAASVYCSILKNIFRFYNNIFIIIFIFHSICQCIKVFPLIYCIYLLVICVVNIFNQAYIYIYIACVGITDTDQKNMINHRYEQVPTSRRHNVTTRARARGDPPTQGDPGSDVIAMLGEQRKRVLCGARRKILWLIGVCPVSSSSSRLPAVFSFALFRVSPPPLCAPLFCWRRWVHLKHDYYQYLHTQHAKHKLTR